VTGDQNKLEEVMKEEQARPQMGRGGVPPAFFRKSAEALMDKGVVKHS
jgi:hypothetical protein